MAPPIGSLRLLARAALTAALVLVHAAPGESNWLTRLAREAGEVGSAGGKVGKLGRGALDAAAAYVARLPPPAKGVALAAHATPEGHWTFANREGEVFTAANADELGRVRGALAPESGADGKLALYLSEDTVFRESARLGDLPGDAELHVVAGAESYPLVRIGAASERLVAEVRPNLRIALDDTRLFEEAVFQLARPLNRANIRVLALAPGGPKTLASAPRRDPTTRTALVDAVDPAAFESALGKVRGQTVLVTGRVEGVRLVYRAESGPESSALVGDLVRAAETSDVNLVLLNSGAARQPGGRNWLWQMVEVAGLDDALGRATMADFFAALAAGGEGLTLSATPGSPGRIVLRALPSGEAAPLSKTVAGWLGEITGNVAVQGVEVFARDAERERELDARLIPGIPSALQIGYLAGLLMGVLGFPVARAWWERLWPPERREEYGGAGGYHAARAARIGALVLLFLPLAGPFAFLWSAVGQVWSVVTAPVRFLAWLRARLRPKAG